MRHFSLPFQTLILTVLIGSISTVATVWLAVAQPWVGLGLVIDPAADQVLIADVSETGPARTAPQGAALLALQSPDGQSAIPLVAQDLIEEPDTIPSYETLRSFRAKQGELVEMLRRPSVTLELMDVEGQPHLIEVSPAPSRPAPSADRGAA